MGNISGPQSPVNHQKLITIEPQTAPAQGPTQAPPSLKSQEIKDLLKDIELGSGDQKNLKNFDLGKCDTNFCFVDIAPERSMGELMKAARTASSPKELEEIVHEVQDRSGDMGNMSPSDISHVMHEVVMNPKVAPSTVTEVTQHAISGLLQKDNKAAFGVDSAYADIIASVAQSPVHSQETDTALAGIKPDRFPPTIAPYLRNPVMQAQERLRQGQAEALQATVKDVHGSKTSEQLSKQASETLAQLRAGKLDQSDGILVLTEILGNKATSPQTAAEIVNYGLQGLQTRDSRSAGGVNSQFADLLSAGAQSSSTPKQALAILAALKPDQYPPTVAPYLRSVVSDAAAQLKHE